MLPPLVRWAISADRSIRANDRPERVGV